MDVVDHPFSTFLLSAVNYLLCDFDVCLMLCGLQVWYVCDETLSEWDTRFLP